MGFDPDPVVEKLLQRKKPGVVVAAVVW